MSEKGGSQEWNSSPGRADGCDKLRNERFDFELCHPGTVESLS
jgi:hypothetical protein